MQLIQGAWPPQRLGDVLFDRGVRLIGDAEHGGVNLYFTDITPSSAVAFDAGKFRSASGPGGEGVVMSPSRAR
ncbi:hypothetical protein MTO96_001597 [Rhipicephalus appendiculatus]